jgi:hypothetical protein
MRCDAAPLAHFKEATAAHPPHVACVGKKKETVASHGSQLDNSTISSRESLADGKSRPTRAKRVAEQKLSNTTHYGAALTIDSNAYPKNLFGIREGPAAAMHMAAAALGASEHRVRDDLLAMARGQSTSLHALQCRVRTVTAMMSGFQERSRD